MEQNRTKNSLKNSISSITCNFVAIFVVFLSRTIFIRALGEEYLGLDGLFSNVLSMLNLFELGIGSAIVFNMYKPIANNDIKKICSLSGFYKKAYNIIAFTIFLAGMIVMFFVPYLANDVTININYYLVFFLSLMSTISSYLFAYKRNIIIAYQKNYIINYIHLGYLLLFHSLEIIILLLTKNYYYYLILKILCQLLENIVINYACKIKFPFINKKAEKLDKRDEKQILKKVKSLFFHQVGGVIVFSTDNIIISKFINVATVGIYSNYSMIVNQLTNVFGQLISSVTSSVGNLLVENNINKIRTIFKNIRFINFWVSCFTSICLLCLIQPFIKLWLGEKFLLGIGTVIIISINFFQRMQRGVYDSFKNAAGIWEPDKYVPLIEGTINILFSIILVKKIGISGVFLGTFLSGLVLWLYSYPKLVYKKVLNLNYLNYFKETGIYFFLYLFLSISTLILCNIFEFNSFLIQFLYSIAMSIIFPNVIITLIYKNSDEFHYCIGLLRMVLKKIKGGIK